jgi:hypothetical protein
MLIIVLLIEGDWRWCLASSAANTWIGNDPTYELTMARTSSNAALMPSGDKCVSRRMRRSASVTSAVCLVRELVTLLNFDIRLSSVSFSRCLTLTMIDSTFDPSHAFHHHKRTPSLNSCIWCMAALRYNQLSLFGSDHRRVVFFLSWMISTSLLSVGSSTPESQPFLMALVLQC